MPNWTYNKISCKKILADKLLTKKDDKYLLDFNKLIPMPETLQVTAGSIEDKAVASYYLSLNAMEQIEVEQLLKNSVVSFYGNYWDKYSSEIEKYKSNPNIMKEANVNFIEKSNQEDNYKKFSNLIDFGEQYVANIRDYKFSNWYDWCSQNWGTKWNVGYDCDVEYNKEIDGYDISFNTAWSIPTGIFEKFQALCEDGDLYWLYEDEDYDGTHILTKENGEIVITTEFYNEEDMNVC